MQTIQYSDFIKRYDVNFRAKPNDEDFVGSGGFGYVYKGYDKLSHLSVAVKRSATDKNLLDEVEKAKQLPQHVNIARYLEGFRIETEADDFDVAILQYYPKGNLNQLIASRELNDKQIRDLVLGILEGISFLHKGFTDSNGKHRSIIHRDLKPQNILIAEYKGAYTPLITDFGISKLVKAEDIHSTGGIELSNQMGTMMYKAPEQVLGGTVRSNLDLWAFGIILFKMLTGKLPFGADSQMSTESVLNKITKSDLEEIFIQLKNYPEVYQRIIRKCLVRDIRNRVQTADELIEMLKGSQNLIKVKNEKNTNHHIFEDKTDDRNDLEGKQFEIPHSSQPEEMSNHNQVAENELGIRYVNELEIKHVFIVASAILAIIFLIVFFSIAKNHTSAEANTNSAGVSIIGTVQKAVDFGSPDPKITLDKTLDKNNLVNEMVSAIDCIKTLNCDTVNYIFYCDEIYFENNLPTLEREASSDQLYTISSVLEAYPKLTIQLTKTLYSKNVNNHEKTELWTKRLESVKRILLEIGIAEPRILIKVNEEELVNEIIKTNSENRGIAINI